MIHPFAVRAARAGAFLLGLGIFLPATLVTLGLALMAPLGIWLAHRIQRARRMTIGGWGSWTGAFAATTLAGLILAGVAGSRVSPDTWRHIRHAADSASAAAPQQPPPEWLTRLAPAAGAPSVSVKPPSALVGSMVVWSMAMGVGITSAVFATLLWGATMLIIFSLSGRWFPPPPAQVESPS